jgi:hypothetical protein
MGAVIELNAAKARLASMPANIWALRWRIKTITGVEIVSAWTPETRYPSIQGTFLEFGGQIESLYIDGLNYFGQQVTTFARFPGYSLASISYKAMGFVRRGRTNIVGIEVEDIEGLRYLILRDGTIYSEERAGGNVANNN